MKKRRSPSEILKKIEEVLKMLKNLEKYNVVAPKRRAKEEYTRT